jgi:hypothetical protein
MKVKLALFMLLLVSTLTFAQNAGIWNFYTIGPYGPPDSQITGGMTIGTLYVNQINLIGPDFIWIGNATFNSLVKSKNTSMLGCLYNDLVSAPVWESLVAIDSKGPTSLSAPDVLFSGPQVFYFAFAETGGSTAAIESFQTGMYPQIAAIYNYNTVRWGTSANYVDGQGCPASLGPLTAANPATNVPAFFLEP